MKTIEYKGIQNKSAWSRGPWDDEPDKAQWLDEKTKLPCLIVRNDMGALCGYVGVPQSHSLFGEDDDNVPNISVHGGLTFSGRCGPHEHGICHKVEEGESDIVWWFGFDCSHSGDLSPAYEHRYWTESYRDWHYVRQEVESLAVQLLSAA